MLCKNKDFSDCLKVKIQILKRQRRLMRIFRFYSEWILIKY